MAISYLDAPLGYKIRKVLRYVSLYGLRRTWVKIRGQFHMRRKYPIEGRRWHNPSCRKPEHNSRFVAIIGCGNFGYSGVAFYLARRSRQFLRATMDTNLSRAVSLCESYGGVYATDDAEAILADPAIQLVYIVSNHASHADYAIRCIEAGKHVHIEKPHVVTNGQLVRLVDAQRKNPDSMVFLGFNRPKSRHFKRVQNALNEQSGPTIVNWFIAGHEIPDDHWYFQEEEGGRVLGNLCHWTDLTLQMIGPDRAFPCVITPNSHPDTRSDFCVGIRFADSSVAGITFSVKGHLFEGVREVLQAHRGDTLVRLWDFEESLIETMARRRRFKTRHRDHGHRTNIVGSYDSVFYNSTGHAIDEQYLCATSRLILGVKEAIDSGESVTIGSPFLPGYDSLDQNLERSANVSPIRTIATAPPYRENRYGE